MCHDESRGKHHEVSLLTIKSRVDYVDIQCSRQCSSLNDEDFDETCGRLCSCRGMKIH